MIRYRAAAPVLLSLAAACGADASASTADAAAAAAALASRPGAVFTMTDDASGNAVLAFSRAADGTLQPAGSAATGGLGSGGGEGALGSQGALALGDDGRFLVVVNAGSDDLSAFRVDGASVALTGRAPSGGALPVSVTVHGDLVYVANAGRGTTGASISGLWLRPDGTLVPIEGSTRPLGAASAGPAEIAFAPDGEALVVTEKGTRSIDVYRVGEDGAAVGPAVFPSAGATPFGFAITRRDEVIVSEAQGGQAGASSASSYLLDDGALEPISASVADGQTAACWLVATRSGRLAFTANAASADLSAYRVDARGDLALLAGDAASIPGGTPLDLALAAGDRFLSALDAGNHAIAAFAVGADGSLAALPAQASGLPAHAVGLAAR